MASLKGEKRSPPSAESRARKLEAIIDLVTVYRYAVIPVRHTILQSFNKCLEHTVYRIILTERIAGK